MGSSESLHYSDQDLIRNIKEGGFQRRRSEEQLFSKYTYFIREGIRKYNLTEDECFSAYSDSILTAINGVYHNQFEAKSALKTWLYQIFHHKCVDLLRKKTTNKNSVNRPAPITDGLLLLSDTAKPVIQKLIDQTDWDLLRQKLNDIEEKCRQILLLWGDRASDKEIAEQLTYKTADVAKTSRLRCLEKLRRLYMND